MAENSKEPYLVSRIENYAGKTIETAQKTRPQQIFSLKTASELRTMLHNVTVEGQRGSQEVTSTPQQEKQELLKNMTQRLKVTPPQNV